MADTPAPTGVRSSTPESYTPRHLGERILASRESLIGERKQVTVLFADVVGSTELIRDRDTEEAQQLLDGVVQLMMDAVHRYEGTISRLLGDGLMAMFGAPIAHEDHAVRACYAALALLEAARRHAEELRRTHGIVVAVRVGISSGEVVVRTIRDDLHMDYTAMGQTVHLAARMEGLAPPEAAVMTAETLALVEGYVQVRALGPVPVKGLVGPVDVYQLLGAGQARTRLQVAAARGLTRFVGRDSEMAALYRALDRAGAGQGQLAALVGEPGVGKSRLVWEITHSHRTQDWLVLESGSVSYGKATSYLPIIDLLKAYCRIEAVDDARAIREKLTGKLLTLDRALEGCLSPLLALLDAPSEDTGWEMLDPAQRRRQTLDAVKRLLLRESQAQPLLLVFEDLHWIDSETQALLDGLTESLPTARILLLVNYRPEYTHSWGSKGFYTQLRIDPLGETSADELLAGLLGDDPTLEPLKALLATRTEGNPLFLEESVRSLVETGALVGERGAYQLPIPVTSLRMPSTVQAVLAARIDRLEPADKVLLQTAAVIGKDVPDVLLRSVADRTENELLRGLAHLQAAEFVYQARLFPELEYTFKHALTHEVAYGSLLQEQKRVLHARVVTTIETAYPDRLDEHVERLAHHSLRGQVWEKVVMYSQRAGLKDRTRSANREATAYFEHAMEALRNLPPSRGSDEQGVDLRLDLRQALMPLGELDRMLGILREAETHAEALDDQSRIGRVATALSQSYWFLGDYDRAVDAGQRALAAAEMLEDVALQIEANQVLSHALASRGDFRLAIDRLERNVAALAGDPLRRPLTLACYPAVDATAFLSWCLAQIGEFNEGFAVGHEALRIAEAANSPWDVSRALNLVGAAYLTRGELTTSTAMIERCLDLGNTWGIPAGYRWSAFHLGTVHTLSGRAAEGLPMLEHAADHAAYQRRYFTHSPSHAALSAAFLALGRIVDATERGARALKVAVDQGERGYQAEALNSTFRQVA